MHNKQTMTKFNLLSIAYKLYIANFSQCTSRWCWKND